MVAISVGASSALVWLMTGNRALVLRGPTIAQGVPMIAGFDRLITVRWITPVLTDSPSTTTTEVLEQLVDELTTSSPREYRACGYHWFLCDFPKSRFGYYDESWLMFVNREEWQFRVVSIQFPAWLPLTLASVLLAYGAWSGPWRRRRRARSGLCVVCGYNLRGNLSGVCPECGTPFELGPNIRETGV